MEKGRDADIRNDDYDHNEHEYHDLVYNSSSSSAIVLVYTFTQ